MLYLLAVVGACFAAGYVLGAVAEYVIHWALHYVPFKIHTEHHKDFFRKEPRDVARQSHNIIFDMIVAALVFAVMLPLVLITGWLVMLSLYAGIFVHLAIVYAFTHCILHDSSWLPASVRNHSFFSYWKRCHMEHHWHRPHGNFSVTYPFILDRLLGTYIPPRSKYRDVPINTNN